MTGRHDDMTRRAAELAECSLRTCSTAAELMAESEQLADQSAEARDARARVLQRIRERRARGTAAVTGGGDLPVPDPSPAAALARGGHGRDGSPGGSLAGEAPVVWLESGAAMLAPGEAAALAALLEEPAARDGRDPLRARALQAATLLRRRVAAGRQPDLQQRGGPDARRESGDARDDSAEGRDALAGERDRRADARDDRSVERDRLARTPTGGHGWPSSACVTCSGTPSCGIRTPPSTPPRSCRQWRQRRAAVAAGPGTGRSRPGPQRRRPRGHQGDAVAGACRPGPGRHRRRRRRSARDRRARHITADRPNPGAEVRQGRGHHWEN